MFSVIMPLYNKENYVSRAVQSVLSQSLQDFELLIVDDSSTDSSVAVVQEFDDSRIRIIRQENQGPGGARNTGVIEAQHEWVAFLDADDAWADCHLYELAEIIRHYKSVGIVCTRSTEINTRTNKHTEVAVIPKRWSRMEVNYFECASHKSGFIHSSAVAIRRDVFDTVGYFSNYRRGEDQEFWARVCLSYTCAASDRPSSFYYRGTGGIMEQDWANKTGISTRVAESITELSPAVKFVYSKLMELEKSDPKYQSIVNFINSKITLALRFNLYAGHIERLEPLGKLYLRPLHGRFIFWSLVTRLPLLPLKIFFTIRSSLKKYYLVFKS